MTNPLTEIVRRFPQIGDVAEIRPLTSGLINQTYRIHTASPAEDDYVLQRINRHVFTDVDLLQHNIECVTRHIRCKLEERGVSDIERKVLRFLAADDGRTYCRDRDGECWRVSVYIRDSQTLDEVNGETAYLAGKNFGAFEAMLTDLTEPLGETIPHFHDMELRIRQLGEAAQADRAGRMSEVAPLVDELMGEADEMCCAERLHREGRLPKHICHCDTKVSNMLFDRDGQVLCVIDLDTVMPSFVFSDYGDFLRSAACSAAEDEPDTSRIGFRQDIFRAFTRGYLEEAGPFLTPLEVEMLPFAARLFPYMQAVRFLTDYIDGDRYYRISYPTHNLVRARAQHKLFRSAEQHEPLMREYIRSLNIK